MICRDVKVQGRHRNSKCGAAANDMASLEQAEVPSPPREPSSCRDNTSDEGIWSFHPDRDT